MLVLLLLAASPARGKSAQEALTEASVLINSLESRLKQLALARPGDADTMDRLNQINEAIERVREIQDELRRAYGAKSNQLLSLETEDDDAEDLE